MTSTILAFALKQQETAPQWLPSSPGALEALAAHVDTMAGKASVTPLDETGTSFQVGSHWKLMVPDTDTRAIHFVRLTASIAFWRDRLRVDSRVDFVEELRPEHVVLPMAKEKSDAQKVLAGLATATTASPPPPIPPQWGIDRCGFPDVWTTLEQNTEGARAVFVIDNGPPSKKSLLGEDQIRYHARPVGKSSTADHAAAVVGVIAPHRGAVKGFGCSSANIELFNVFDENGLLDKADVCRALVAAAHAKAAVVNMSFTMLDVPRCLAISIAACTRADVLMVAAMGETSAPAAVFPARHPDVIAVGGLTFAEIRDPGWLSGDYIKLSAPAEKIDTVGGRPDGTSFAAPFVASAIWFARKWRPDLSGEVIKKVLFRSVVVPPGAQPVDVGAGRLDMRAMVAALEKIPKVSPDLKKPNKPPPVVKKPSKASK